MLAKKAHSFNLMAGNARSRDWIFTLNNPEHEHKAFIDAVLDKGGQSVQFIVFQKEEGEQKTPHFQGYVRFTNARYFNAVRQWFPWHVEPRRGSKAAALAYATKEETRIAGPWYWPSQSYVQEQCVDNQGRRSDLEHLVSLARAGATRTELLDAHPGSYVRYAHRIHAVVGEAAPFVFHDHRPCAVLFGTSGAGKSHWMFEPAMRGEPFYLKDTTKWWDGYQNEPTVLLDEFTSDAGVSSRLFLKWTDKWPFRGQVKGTYTKLCYKSIIITSNEDPRNWYHGSAQYDAIQRRIDVIIEFEGAYPNTTITVHKGDPATFPWLSALAAVIAAQDAPDSEPDAPAESDDDE